MDISELVEEYAGPRAPGWLVLDASEILTYCIEAARFYAGYGTIKSLSLSDNLPSAPAPGATSLPDWPVNLPDLGSARPVKSLDFISEDTILTVGEWAIIRPLFVLYVERENAQRLEASRAAGLEVYGRSVSEIAQDIKSMEDDVLPAKCFCCVGFEI